MEHKLDILDGLGRRDFQLQFASPPDAKSKQSTDAQSKTGFALYTFIDLQMPVRASQSSGCETTGVKSIRKYRNKRRLHPAVRFLQCARKKRFFLERKAPVCR
eukprot:8729944-Pyramimonas_sp.AAC.2